MDVTQHSKDTMYTYDGTMLCSATGTTIDPTGEEGYYIYTEEDGTEHHLCALAYTLFDTLLQDTSFSFKNLPEEAHKRFVWVFVGDPNSCLFGGEIRDKVARLKDQEKRARKKKEARDRKKKEDAMESQIP